MKIYTKTGDKGKTSLFDGTRVNKDNIRLETYGTFDELSSLLGITQSFLRDKKLIQELQSIQKDLLDIGGCLANPRHAPSKRFLSYLDKRVVSFEKMIDSLTEQLMPLTSFILFTGNRPSGFLQLSRSVARRCERHLISLSREAKASAEFIRYFNRLSDLLYTMGRFANRKSKKEVIWSPFAKAMKDKKPFT